MEKICNFKWKKIATRNGKNQQLETIENQLKWKKSA